jgi:HSP20 family protein
MTLVKRTSNLFPSVPSFFDDYFVKDLMGWSNTNSGSGNGFRSSLPAVNIREDENLFEVEVAAPGLSKEDFNVQVEHDVLTISSEKEDKEENANYTRREFGYASFKRQFTLPENAVDVDKVNASHKNGVLHILLPKREEVKPKPAKTIKIG